MSVFECICFFKKRVMPIDPVEQDAGLKKRSRKCRRHDNSCDGKQSDGATASESLPTCGSADKLRGER
jgi:hypothetical protein